MPLPVEFQNEIIDSNNYPKNLRFSLVIAYGSTLKAYKQRLDDAESRLCLVTDKQIRNDFEVPIRDLHTDSGEGV